VTGVIEFIGPLEHIPRPSKRHATAFAQKARRFFVSSPWFNDIPAQQKH
jgi:hypothetical protein